MLRTLALGVGGTLMAASAVLLAHHDRPVDRTRPITLHGTVTAFTWANPHVTVAVEVQSDGAVEKWLLGASSPKYMGDNDWDKTTLKYPFRNGST